jgi:nucleoside phosphorylase
MVCDVLLLGAFHPELAPLHGALGEAMRARVGTREVAARVVGIGLPMAAAGAALQLAELQPRTVVLLGTCGAYAAASLGSVPSLPSLPSLPSPASPASPKSASLGLGDVVVSRRVRLLEPAAVDGMAQFPEPMSIATDAHPATVDALVRAGARAVDVGTTLAITTDDATADRLARATGAHVEHLEAHGVAMACAARGVAFAAVLGVANFVGARARDEWRANHRAAAAAAAEVALRWVRQEA